MISVHKRYIPAFGFQGHRDQYPVCVYTILSANPDVGDCAAYEAVGPTMPGASDAARAITYEAMRAGGNKISEADARELFSEIEDMQLRYRR